MADPSPGDSPLSILSNFVKTLADNITFARNTLSRASLDRTSQGLDVMTEESLYTLNQDINLLERIRWSIDAVIIKEQARGAGDRGYVPAMTVGRPGYRANHTHELGNEVGAILSVIDRIDGLDTTIDPPPDQTPAPNWSEFNEMYSEKVECPPGSEESLGSGGARSIHYHYKCTYRGCSSRPMKYKSKLRYVFLIQTS